MPPDNLLFELATDLLSAVVGGLQTAGLDVPDRRYVHAGTVALDNGPGTGEQCADQLVVTFLPGDFLGLPGFADETALVCEQPPTAVYQIWLSRCVPIIDEQTAPPTPGELQAAARKTMQDAREVWRAVYVGHREGDLFEDSPCRLIRMAGGQVQGPAGGVTSYTMTVEVSLI